MLATATQIVLGDTSLEQAGAEYLAARRAERAALAALTGAIVASARPGVSEYDLARLTGVSRPTVRKALGK